VHGLDLADDGLHPIRSEVGDDNRGTFIGEPMGRRPSHPAGSTRDDRRAPSDRAGQFGEARIISHTQNYRPIPAPNSSAHHDGLPQAQTVMG